MSRYFSSHILQAHRLSAGIESDQRTRNKKAAPTCDPRAEDGDSLSLLIAAARSLAGLVPVQSSLLLSFVRRYFLELALSTTGHLGSPWKRMMRITCRYCRVCAQYYTDCGPASIARLAFFPLLGAIDSLSITILTSATRMPVKRSMLSTIYSWSE